MMKKLTAILLLLALLLAGCAGPAPAPETAAPTEAIQTEADLLTVHYIDVGQADCALIECGGEFMLIDGGNVADGQLVVTYLENQGVETLKYVICTHAHEDHVGGLASVLAVYPTENVWAPTRTYSSRCFDDFVYYTDQQGLEITLTPLGETFTLGTASFAAIGPLESYPDTNDTSIVLRLTHGENTFLFTGDMERTPEQDLLDAGAPLKADVLKVGHHGSSSSTSYRFLYEVDPEYAIISCGKDNSYGHPHEEVVARLQDAGVPYFRTDQLGTVLAVSDGAAITITWENQNAAPENAEEADSRLVGNKNSKVLHTMSCTGLPQEQNRVYFDSYDEAIEAGYTPCRNCMG